MPEFRRKPIQVSAIRFTGANQAECAALIPGAEFDRERAGVMTDWMMLETPLHHVMINEGEWIVRYPEGNFDVMGAPGFHREFEPIGGDSHA